jgi:hypothetical protein
VVSGTNLIRPLPRCVTLASWTRCLDAAVGRAPEGAR